MNPIRIFISSVQSEFAQERAALRDYLRGDPLMRRFFDVFLFEDVPASDRRPDDLYLDEGCAVGYLCRLVRERLRIRGGRGYITDRTGVRSGNRFWHPSSDFCER